MKRLLKGGTLINQQGPLIHFFHLSADAVTEGVLALLQINIGLNIWACHSSVLPLWAPE